jgi:hypothetical protein
MLEKHVDIPTAHGAMNTFVVQGVYHKPSAERHWERLFDLFRRKLS